MLHGEQFPRGSVLDQSTGQRRHFQSVVCGECGETVNFYSSGRLAYPEAQVIKSMQKKGWVMGRRRKDDICPKCLLARRADKPHHTPTKKAIGNGALPELPGGVHIEPFIKPTKTKETAMSSAKPGAVTKTPSREEKRLILFKIEDFYLGPDKGYKAGVNDKTIAADLNVPWKWVADLREEFFGPVTSAEMAGVNAAIKDAEEKMAAHEREGRELRSLLMSLKERIAKLEGELQ